MSRRFDDLTRRAGTMRTRRQVFGLLGRGAAAAFVGSQALQFLDAPTVSAEDCLVEYPPANLDDCPNRRPHPGNVRGFNGCGAANSDFRPRQGFGTVNFQPACNGHDICYETCLESKSTCDVTFGDQLVDACIAGYSGSFLRETACISLAGTFQLAVTVAGGSAYEEGQKKDCECCHPVTKIRCDCKNTCYDDVAVCVDACKGLGCFVGSCYPVPIDQCP